MTNILIWMAVLPSIILIRRVLALDKVESEPTGLLIKVFVLGCLSCIPATVLEVVGDTILLNLDLSEFSYAICLFLLLVPFSEESVKYLAMRSVRKRQEFNYTFDGIVYGVMASLGFATLENLIYVLGYGDITLAAMRAISSIPTHCVCGVFMGYYYGMSNRYKALGQSHEARGNAVLALLIPVAIHGIYDFSLSVEDPYISIFGFVFTLVMYALAIHRVRLSSKNDEAFWGGYEG
ncbi:MAG: PrsW family glutamic-type intramembrane protease [Coriobacteriales bacterium]|nr:PrsW family glutamic-type intramembrane protease [Coriobacteriales bacterium]